MSPTIEHDALVTALTHHLCDAWGWLADEPEALRLAQNLAAAAPDLVKGTRVTPATLFAALTGRDLDQPAASSPDDLFAETVDGVAQVTDLPARR